MFFSSRKYQAMDPKACRLQGIFQALSIEGVDVRIGNDRQGL